MPLTEKGRKIKAAMVKEYGKERGERVFYASENKGTIKGVAKKGVRGPDQKPRRKSLRNLFGG